MGLMRMSKLPLMRRFIASLVFGLATSAAIAAQDVLLVLDNSGSMRPLDPDYRSRSAAGEFLAGLPEDTRIGLVLFDQHVRLTNSLATADARQKAALAASLGSMDLRGQLTQSPSALEAAILELSLKGRPEAARLIVFATDGLVDTGSPSLDRQRAAWMRGDLAAQAATARIRILPIAFTAGADLDMLGALAARTGGEVVRAIQPQDLTAAYARIQALIADAKPLDPETEAQAAARAASLSAEEKAALETLAQEAGLPVEAVVAGVESEDDSPVPQPATPDAEAALVDEFMTATPESLAAETAPPAAVPAPAVTPATAPEPLVVSPEERAALEEMAEASGVSVEELYRELQSAPANTTVIVGQKKTGLAANPMPLVWAFGVLVVLAGGFLWLRRRRADGPVPADDPSDVTQPLPFAPTPTEPEAFLLDLHGITDTPTLRITGRQLVVGRSLGTDTEHVDYFIVNKATVGRRHAIIKWKDGAFWLVDLGSVNGTYVNDERLLGERILRTGDRLRFHKFEFEFSAPGQVPARLDTRKMEEQTQIALEDTRLGDKASRPDLTDPGDFQSTDGFPAPSGVTVRPSAFELTELEADRDAFFSAPEAGDVNFEPRRVAGDDDMTYDDREARTLFDTLARRQAGPDPDATQAGPIPGALPLDPEATQAGPRSNALGVELAATQAGSVPPGEDAKTTLSGEDTAESDAFFTSNTMTGFAADLMEDDRTFEVPLPVREELRSANPPEMLATRVLGDASATGEFAPGDMERTLQVDATVIRQADFMETDVFNANATQVSSLPKSPVGAPPTASPAPADDDASGFFTDDPPPRR